MNALTLFNNNLLDTIFDTFDRDYIPSNYYSPKVDVSETENSYELAIEVPGFNEKDLNVEVKNGVLSITGEVKNEKEEKDENKKYIMKERCISKFERSFKLPENVNHNKIGANLKNGVLNLSLEKQEEEKPKQIKIN